ncbi:hypothetical protein N1027_01295 [Herbiconiux sp. CPCC 205763]|uniref:Uncharacterized protein n=1 Tax=Herbiconiux aconitum TaxID=2970913 RepID=A0ABT2GKM7_9MICO|nr:hypothetical protein [Herbiconiux aconitum]MCS5716765.1 hypothetical protein [Herbiconiux aconitum]
MKNSALYKVGEYIMISGNDIIPNSTNKHGYMRRVAEISGSQIRIDAPIPREVRLNPRIALMALAPTLRIFGAGSIFNTSPSAGRSPLIDFFATNNPQVSGITVSDNGTTGINVAHSLGGTIDCTVRDLLNDSTVYFGYGVNVSGATRGLVVKGTMLRVRHAVTTNAGPDLPNIGPAGEPEDCHFEPHAIDCSDKGVDTHRVGWNTTIVPHVEGGRGGVQVRADNTKVLGGTIVGGAGPGVAITSVVAVAAQVEDVSISRLQASGSAIFAQGPVNAKNITIRDSYGPNIVLSSNCTVEGGSISGGSPVGVSFTGSNNSVTNIQLGDSVTTPYIAAAGTTNNTFTTAPPVDIEPMPAPVCTVPPVVSGEAKVAKTLSVSPGTWSLPIVTYLYTWRRDGVDIVGGVDRTNPRYDTVAADVGHTLTAVVRAKRPGYAVGEATSEPLTIAPGDALVPATPSTITGSPVVGSWLTIIKGAWTPGAQSSSVQWLLDGTDIPGVNTATYRVRSTDTGHRISVRVTAVRAGWTNGVSETASLLVQ